MRSISDKNNAIIFSSHLEDVQSAIVFVDYKTNNRYDKKHLWLRSEHSIFVKHKEFNITILINGISFWQIKQKQNYGVTKCFENDYGIINAKHNSCFNLLWLLERL